MRAVAVADWSRGHALTHLTRNADGDRHLPVRARTGVETPEDPTLAARAEEIEACGGSSAADLLADLRGSAAAFEAEYRSMPPEAWRRVVRWTAGQELPAARAADARWLEVLVHHADLDAGHTPVQWPADFVRPMLGVRRARATELAAGLAVQPLRRGRPDVIGRSGPAEAAQAALRVGGAHGRSVGRPPPKGRIRRIRATGGPGRRVGAGVSNEIT